MKHVVCLMALACALAVTPAYADLATLINKPHPAQSTRTAQAACLKQGEECCCERAGPLCCPGLTCKQRGNKGYCEP